VNFLKLTQIDLNLLRSKSYDKRPTDGQANAI
jgi:hypothetical protein